MVKSLFGSGSFVVAYNYKKAPTPARLATRNNTSIASPVLARIFRARDFGRFDARLRFFSDSGAGCWSCCSMGSRLCAEAEQLIHQGAVT